MPRAPLVRLRRTATSLLVAAATMATLSPHPAAAAAAASVAAAGLTNVLGGSLAPCGFQPLTGFFRDGLCRTDAADRGRHVIAAVVTAQFLAFTASRGNDLSTPHPPSFPGLKPGDRWCLCALRWREALEAGAAPPVDLSATSSAALNFVTLEQLRSHAWVPPADSGGEGGAGEGGARAGASPAGEGTVLPAAAAAHPVPPRG